MFKKIKRLFCKHKHTAHDHTDLGLHESNWQICKYNQGFYIEFQEESLYRKELGYWENKVVVIGNIYDSPKLLEDKENKHGEDI